MNVNVKTNNAFLRIHTITVVFLFFSLILKTSPEFSPIYATDHIGESTVCLKSETKRKLKHMVNSEALDSNFISILLSDVFGNDMLKESSAGEGKSNYNNSSHKALEKEKLKFIKSKNSNSSYCDFISIQVSIHLLELNNS